MSSERGEMYHNILLFVALTFVLNGCMYCSRIASCANVGSEEDCCYGGSYLFQIRSKDIDQELLRQKLNKGMGKP